MRPTNPLRDKQQDPPALYCSECGGEIYPGERYYLLHGEEVICNTCITEEEAE
ncbi:MAG: hypothetical protein LUE61_07140 [Clostridiales bacterium]|nr:hypothetical protein [Clostridiales bacterium]